MLFCSQYLTHPSPQERAGRYCGGLRVLNSYWVGEDSVYKFFEVILVDPQHKAIRRDPRINWICNAVHKHRELRGLTAAGRKNRGLGKGHLRNKVRGARDMPTGRGTIHCRCDATARSFSCIGTACSIPFSCTCKMWMDIHINITAVNVVRIFILFLEVKGLTLGFN